MQDGRQEVVLAGLRNGQWVYISVSSAARLSQNLPVPGQRVACYTAGAIPTGQEVAEVDVLQIMTGSRSEKKGVHRWAILSETGGTRQLV